MASGATGSVPDAVVVGAGHNGLTAAAYLARAGRRVLVLEAADHVGGAAISAEVFPGVPARLSRYSYLVSLLPEQIRDELGLRLELRSRSVASFTPLQRGGAATGLLVERDPGPATRESFRALTGSDAAFDAWMRFYDAIAGAAQALAPTMLEPLPSHGEARDLVSSVAGEETWEWIAGRPLGDSLAEVFDDDDIRGIVATDGLIGTFASLHDPSLLANRCFLYHLVGDGTGEWKVPVGGMGAVSGALEEAARRHGAEIRTGARVMRIDAGDDSAEVAWVDADGVEHSVTVAHVLANVAPSTLDGLRGRPVGEVPRGAQMKVNMLLTRLPRLRSGIDPRVAFAGTLHVDESMTQVETAYAQAASGSLPTALPFEIYCHTLTDSSILAPELVERGWQTLTLFGLHTPVELFTNGDNDALREQALRGYIAGLDAYLDEPLEDCLARDAEGRPCIEARTPLDLVADVGLPGGNIFHRDLRWPWAAVDDGTPGAPDSVPGAWGVETDAASLVVCGAGARRGGGVSGIPGRNAALAILAGR